MILLRRIVLVITLAFLVLFYTLNASAEVQKITYFSSRNFELKVLTADSWEASVGKNPKVPRTDEEILALARSVYPPLGAKPPAAERKKWHCGDMEVGRLFSALQNPAITDETREAVDRIIIQATPDLPEEYTSGRFIIRYTTTDADPLHNVTLEDVKALAANLNANWNSYATNFTEPMHYHDGDQKDRIGIYVYYIDNETWGQTSNAWTYIDINSLILDIPCTRKITAAHELFHRVQFAYGLAFAGDDWLVEGTATWSEKYRYPTEREYLDWMNRGLETPAKDLFARDYDAVHLFVYLTERTGWSTVRDIWAKYQALGAEEAFKITVEMRLGGALMKFLRDWHTANFVKDLRYAPPKYDYTEDEVKKIDCVGDKYGPLGEVARHTQSGICRLPFTLTRSVERYGTDYVVFETPTNPKYLTIEITGEDDFSYRIIPVRGKTYLRVYNGNTNPFIFTRPSGTEKWTKFAVLVVGGATGGNYTVTLKDNLEGTWTDNHGFVWMFERLSGSDVQVTSVESLGPNGYCGTYFDSFYNNPCSDSYQIEFSGFTPTAEIPFDCSQGFFCCTLWGISAKQTGPCTIIGSTKGSRSGCNIPPTYECAPGPFCCLVDSEGPYKWTFTKQTCP